MQCVRPILMIYSERMLFDFENSVFRVHSLSRTLPIWRSKRFEDDATMAAACS
jgi:hypothetical protein